MDTYYAKVILTPYFEDPQVIPFLNVEYKTFTFEVPMDLDLEGEILEWVFRTANIAHQYDPPDPQAVQYRAEQNRSLSSGDLVLLYVNRGDEDIYLGLWQCQNIGWERV